jgi:serine hydrolase
MKTAEADIIIVPGWSSSGPDHWQSRWQRNLPTARRVEQEDWYNATRDAWVGTLISDIAVAERPVVLIAHSLGVMTVVHAAQKLPKGMITGAFLVAPADVEQAMLWPPTKGYTLNPEASGFAPVPRDTLPFPSAVVASVDDPYCTFERASDYAAAWGATLHNAGALGHINVDSGQGPWPEGVLKFGAFLKTLSAD